MTNSIQPTNGATVESVVIGGDLSKLTPEQRVSYYQQVCQSLGLNPLTRPFDYITLNGKLTLYARKDAAEQLRKINGISIEAPDIKFQDEWIIVTVVASDVHGRKDSDVGVVSKKDMQGNFGNALMKAVTKAKRRVTLSISGLGMLDETEVETIPGARVEVIDDVPMIAEVLPEPTMTLDQAYNFRTSEGIQYGTMDNAQFPPMLKAIQKKLSAGGLTEEEAAEYALKAQACQVIIKARKVAK